MSMIDYNINTLPRELYNIVLNNLSVDELKNLSQTNKMFSEISENNDIWSYLLNRDFGRQLPNSNAKSEYIHLTKLSRYSTYIYANLNSRGDFGNSFAINATSDQEVHKIIYRKYMNKELPRFLQTFINSMLFPGFPQTLSEYDMEEMVDDEAEGYLPIPNMNTTWSTVFSYFTDEETMNETVEDISLKVQKAIFN